MFTFGAKEMGRFLELSEEIGAKTEYKNGVMADWPEVKERSELMDKARARYDKSLKHEPAATQDVNAVLDHAIQISREAILNDHTGLAETISEMQKVIKGYAWLKDYTDWGSYSYTERNEITLRNEITYCLNELEKIAKAGLNESGDKSREWVNTISDRLRQNTKQEGDGK